jgi:protease I
MINAPSDLYNPETQNRISTIAVLILTANKTEDLEFFYPYYRFIEEGYKVDVATPHGGSFSGKQGLGLKNSLKVSDVDQQDYELLYIPGGKAPVELVKHEEALVLTRQFVQVHKTVAAICHGPQVLAAAGVIAGRRISAWPEVEEEINKAGAAYINHETVIDGQFITARWPGDLPAFMKVVLERLRKTDQSSEILYSAAQ